MHALGARTLIVTNASGGINTAYSVGDLMLIADHINFTGTHPLTFGPGSKTEAKTEAKAEAKTGVKAGHSPRSAQDAGIGSAGAFGLAQVFTSTFPDMTFAYTPHLRALARQAAHNSGITLREGVYLGLRGPSFETPAEIRAFRMWGADAVGMSTVHEVIVARALGMDVLGLSLITNMAAGILEQPITSQEVYDTARQSAHKMGTLVEAILPQLPQLKQ
jgi:purine-nucleoside phosphorylase